MLSETGFPRQINEQTRAIYKQLGKFYSIVSKKNTLSGGNRFVTGALFHAGFFQILQKVARDATVEELRQEATRQISAAAGENPAWSPLILQPENRGKLEAYAAALDITPEEALTATHEQVDQFVNAARAFYEAATTDFKEKILLTDPAALAREIQGNPITKQGLLRALVKSFALSEECFRWIQEKIQTSNDEWRARFVSVITGCGALSLDTTIYIYPCNPRRREGTFEIHTCSSSLAVPQGQNKELFLQALDAVLSDGYNVA